MLQNACKTCEKLVSHRNGVRFEEKSAQFCTLLQTPTCPIRSGKTGFAYLYSNKQSCRAQNSYGSPIAVPAFCALLRIAIRAGQRHAAQCSAAQRSTPQHSTAESNAAPRSARTHARMHAAQHTAAQHVLRSFAQRHLRHGL